MLVWQEVGENPADEDGFGAESYYNMFYLDEFFRPIPGIAMVEAMSKRGEIPLWTEFAE